MRRCTSPSPRPTRRGPSTSAWAFARRPGLYGEDGALAGDVDGPAEGLLGLALRPVGVELVGDVGQHEPAHARLAAVLAGLGRGEMPARALTLGPGQRRLDHEQVGAVGEAHEILVGCAVGAVGE